MHGKSASARRLGLFLVLGCSALLIATQVRAQVTLAVALVPAPESSDKTPPVLTKLRDKVRVTVEADSPSGIARVTFEVDDQFRAEVKKPPYLFDWDTLDENDGAHTLAVTAYNGNGQTGVKRIKLSIENQLSLGIGYFVEQALEAFRQGNALSLERAARKAFKINPADPSAIRVMALSVGIKGDLGRAFGMLDNPQNNIPKNDALTEEVRGYLLLIRAVNAPNLAAMTPDIQTGLTLMRRRMAGYAEVINAKYPEGKADFATQIARGDGLFAINRFDDALAAYQRAVALASDRTGKRRANLRIGLSLLWNGRYAEAETAAKRLIAEGDTTGTSNALLGAALFNRRQYLAAREAVQESAHAKNVAAIVVAAMTDTVLGNRTDAYNEAREAVKAVDTVETQYAAQAVLADAGDPVEARKAFQEAYLRQPFILSPLISHAFEVMAYDRAEDRFVQALNLFTLLQTFEPENPGALAGRSAALLYLKRFSVAEPLLRHLNMIDPLAADKEALLAVEATRPPGNEAATRVALNRANQMDPLHFKDAYLPSMTEIIARMARLRRVIPLTPYLIDFSDAPPPAAKTASTTGS